MLIQNKAYFLKSFLSDKYLNIDSEKNLIFTDNTGVPINILSSMYAEFHIEKGKDIEDVNSVLINKVDSNLILSENDNYELVWSPSVSKFFENWNRFRVIHIDSSKNLVFLVFHGRPVIYDSNVGSFRLVNKSLQNCVEDEDDVVFQFVDVKKEGYGQVFSNFMDTSSINNKFSIAILTVFLVVFIFILISNRHILLAKLKNLYKSSRRALL